MIFCVESGRECEKDCVCVCEGKMIERERGGGGGGGGGESHVFISKA